MTLSCARAPAPLRHWRELPAIPFRIDALGEDTSLRVDAASARDQLIDAARDGGRNRACGSSVRASAPARASTTRPAVRRSRGRSRGRRIPARAAERGISATQAGFRKRPRTSPRVSPLRSLLVVDPIDGTRAFLAGDPRWAVSIALVVGDRPIAGVVHAPALGETYAAARGCGSTLNGAAIAGLRSRETLAEARIAGPKPMVEAIGRAAGVSLLSAAQNPLARLSDGAGRQRRARSGARLGESRTIGTSPPPI